MILDKIYLNYARNYDFVPSSQKSFALASKCDHVVWLGHYKARFVQSMLPEDVTLANEHVLHRPANWK